MPSLPTTPLRPHSPPRVRAGRAAPATISLAGLLTVSVCAARAQGQVPAPRRYTVVPLDVPGAVVTVAHGINAAGQVVGTYSDSAYGAHGFLWGGAGAGAVTRLDAPGAVGATVARGITDAGQVVGFYKDAARHAHGFLYRAGVFTPLDAPGAVDTYAEGIDAAGEVVGWYNFSDSTSASGGVRAFRYAGGTFTPLDLPGAGLLGATGLTTGGQIVGFYGDSSRELHGFLEGAGAFRVLDVPGTTHGTFPEGVNAAGQVVGTYTDTLGRHGFVYAEGAFLPLDAPGARLGPRSGTSAHGVNAAGQVVGDYFDGAHMHGFVATPRR